MNIVEKQLHILYVTLYPNKQNQYYYIRKMNKYLWTVYYLK